MVEKMSNVLRSELGSLAGEYRPIAIYYHDSDCVEYAQHDVLCVYDRIDQFLTLITDETQKNVIGFKLKGFSKAVKEMLGTNADQSQFLQLINVIESVCTQLGDDLFGDDDRQQAYDAAKKIASHNNLILDKATLPEAYVIAAINHNGQRAAIG
jgi:dTDP-glucose pyrophosphorylase